MKYILSCLALVMLSLSSCDNTKSNQAPEATESSPIKEAIIKESQPGFVHAVYFWLKKDNPELLKEFIEVGLPQLAKVPSIKNVYWGPPAGTPRDVVDNSYDLSWIVMFNNAEDQDKYQVDPLHVEFVEKYKSLFEKVQVYDSLVNGSE